MTSLDPAVCSLVSAAAVLAGPNSSAQRLEDALIRIALHAREGSPTLARLERVLDAHAFVAELLAVDLEETSTRAVLKLRTAPEAPDDDGVEWIRTDRTDTDYGARIASRARDLIHHRVVIHKVLEDIGSQRQVRVCVWLTDLGWADQ